MYGVYHTVLDSFLYFMSLRDKIKYRATIVLSLPSLEGNKGNF